MNNKFYSAMKNLAGKSFAKWYAMLSIMVIVLLSTTNIMAQLVMTRTTFTGAYPTIAGTPIPAAQGDDVFQGAVPIGFTFTFNAVAYTTVGVNSNGWISFTAVGSSAANSGLGTNAAPNATLAPWWDDLTSSSVQSLTTGVAGSRIFTMQWVSLSYFSGSTRTINYQVKLYETTN